jgi:hypothetical protein
VGTLVMPQLGDVVSVFWPLDRAWYEGAVECMPPPPALAPAATKMDELWTSEERRLTHTEKRHLLAPVSSHSREKPCLSGRS